MAIAWQYMADTFDGFAAEIPIGPLLRDEPRSPRSTLGAVLALLVSVLLGEEREDRQPGEAGVRFNAAFAIFVGRVVLLGTTAP